MDKYLVLIGARKRLIDEKRKKEKRQVISFSLSLGPGLLFN
jgi:hypothetical protein